MFWRSGDICLQLWPEWKPPPKRNNIEKWQSQFSLQLLGALNLGSMDSQGPGDTIQGLCEHGWQKAYILIFTNWNLAFFSIMLVKPHIINYLATATTEAQLFLIKWQLKYGFPWLYSEIMEIWKLWGLQLDCILCYERSTYYYLLCHILGVLFWECYFK